MNLDGKVALVTGGNTGIGKTVVLVCTDHGAYPHRRPGAVGRDQRVEEGPGLLLAHLQDSAPSGSPRTAPGT